MEGFKGKGAAQQQQPKCRVCAQNESLYACPKCNCRYCSSKCYRLHGDGTCVEAFHAESLARMMKNEKHFDGDSEDEEEKKREMEAMVMEYERHVEKDEREMRTRFGLEAKSFSSSSSDDDEEEDEEDEEKEDEDEYCTLSAKLMRAYLKEEEDNKFSGISERDFAASDKKRLERMLRKGEIRVEPWRAWWTIDDDDEVLLRDDGTAKIVALNDDTNNNEDNDNGYHPSSVLGFPSPPTEPLPSYWSLLPPTKRTLKKVSAKQRNVFRERVAGAITLYAIIARAFNGDHACFDAAATYLMHHHHHQNDTNKNNNEEEDKEEEEETNDSVNALLALHVSAVINTHTLVPSGLFYDASKSGKVAKNLESDAYAMLRSRSKRVLAMEDLRSMFRKAIEDSYYDDDDDDTTNNNNKKKNNKEFRSNCRKMERKLFFAECFANVTDEEFFAANSVADDEADAEAALMKVSSSSSSYPKEIQLTTSTEHNKIVSNAYAFDANSENICFDVRSHVGGHVFDGDLIQLVDVNTKEVKTVLRTAHEAKCGVALFHPFDENVLCCIVGPRHPTEEWAYCAHHRRGYVIDLSEDSNVDSSSSSNAQQLNSSRSLSSNLEARDLVSPFTKGALRGGTHVHAFSPDGTLVSMTYEDAILADATDVNVSRRNARNIAVTIYKDIVEIDKSRNDRNVSGGFTVCVTETTPDPTLGSDEISRAYEDCWMDSRTLSFLGDCRDERGNVRTELFVVELPRDVEKLKEEEEKEERLLQGTLTSYPKPPKSVKQRRVTRSSGCQGSVRFWPRANPADSNVVCILLRDEKASFQLHLVDATTGEIEQLSFLKDGEEVNSAFSWSPDGLYVCFATSTNRIARTFTRGGARKYQTEYLTPPPRTTNDDNKIRPECVCVSPNGKFVCFLKTTTTSSPTKIVCNVSEDKEEGKGKGKGKGSEHPDAKKKILVNQIFLLELPLNNNEIDDENEKKPTSE